MSEPDWITTEDRALAGFTVWAVLATGGVFATVGWVAAVVIAAMMFLDRFVLPGRRAIATLGVVALALLPFVWLAGSTLPLSPPGPRISDNLWAHQLGGVAVWLLFLGAWLDSDPERPMPGTGEPGSPERHQEATIDRTMSDKEAT